MRKRTWAVALMLVVLANRSATVACAGDEPAAGLVVQKAVRGAANAGLGVVLEVPKTVYYGTLEDGPLYGFTVGILEGLSWGIARTLTGVYEIVTFPFPIPDNYRPIHQPPYPFEAGKTDVAD